MGWDRSKLCAAALDGKDLVAQFHFRCGAPEADQQQRIGQRSADERVCKDGKIGGSKHSPKGNGEYRQEAHGKEAHIHEEDLHLEACGLLAAAAENVEHAESRIVGENVEPKTEAIAEDDTRQQEKGETEGDQKRLQEHGAEDLENIGKAPKQVAVFRAFAPSDTGAVFHAAQLQQYGDQSGEDVDKNTGETASSAPPTFLR